MSCDVSVVIPTFNRARLVCRAVSSVIAQTLAPREIIVVDDGSTDDTLAQLQQQFPAIKIVAQSCQGVSAARNNAIKRARGEWIALLDSDDTWMPEKLEAQMAIASDKRGYRLVHCDERWVRNGQLLAQKKYHRKRGGDIFLECLERCMISPSAALLHRSVFDQTGFFDETLPACEDYDFWLRFCVAENVSFVDRVLVSKYGGHPDQLSRTTAVLDQYRLRSLVELLRSASMTTQQRAAVETIVRRKRDIVLNGAAKHQNTAMQSHIENLCSEVLRA